jgi:hypothetical protein
MPTMTPPRETRAPRLLRARAGSARGALLSIAAAVCVSALLLCGLSTLAEVQLRDAVRAAVPEASVPEGWLQFQTRPAQDADAQDAAASALFSDVLGDAATVERLTVGEPGTDLERVVWRVTPNPDTLGPRAVDRLASGLEQLPEEFRSSDAAERGASVSGGLADAVVEVAAGARAASALLPVPLVVLGVLAWFAVLQLARLLGLSRGRETALLRARGLSRGQSLALAFGESALVAVVGVGLGWAVAVGVAPLLSADSAAVAAAIDTWPLALGMTAVAALTIAIAQLRATRRASRADAAAGRAARAATPAAGVLLIVVAGVLIWQARESPSGAWGVAVATLAPAMGMAAVAVLSVLLFAPAAALLAGVAARGRGVSPSYPARQVARRVAAYSVAVALVAIAVSGAVLAGGYAGMASTTAQDSQRVQAGAALRAVMPVGAGDVDTVAQAEGVSAATPALVATVAAGDEDGVLLALPAASMADVLFDVPGAASPTQLADDVTVESGFVELAGGSLRVEARARASESGAIADTVVRAWIVDAHDTTVSLTLEAERADAAVAPTSFSAEASLPVGEWRLAALEIARGNAWEYADLAFSQIEIFSTGAGALDLPELPIVRLYGGFGSPGISSALAWSATGEEAERVPVAITSALASALALAVGDPVDLAVSASGRVVESTVVSVVEAIPGIGSRPGVLADLATLTSEQLPSRPVVGEPAATPPLPDQLWAAGDEAAAPAMAEALDAPVLTPSSQSTAVTAPVTIVWTASALGGAVLAAIALVALLSAITRQRAGEVLVLRAIGLAPRVQARGRILEAIVVVVTAAVLGVAGGYALTALVVPGLVARAVPSAQLVPALALEVWPVAAALAIIAVGCVVGGLGIARTLRAQSASTRLEEAAP